MSGRTKTLSAILAALTLAGCGNGDVEEPQAFVANGRSKTAAPVESALAETPPEPFHYRAANRRSPFVSAPSALEAGGDRTASGPDARRAKQPLEQFPLRRLRMVGTLTGRGATYALVRDPAGEMHRLAAGDYLGPDHGRITTVAEDGIDLVEIVRDGAGGWMRRSRSLALSPATDEKSRMDQ